MKPSEDSCAECTNMSLDEMEATLFGMRRQEEAGYTCAKNYCANSNNNNNAVDVVCREKMAEWCFQMADFYEYRRETVSVAMSYLDRYCTHKKLDSKKSFSLAAVTSLYLAIKVHESCVGSKCLSIPTLVKLGNGAFTKESITETERDLLAVLQWRVQPPTAMSFCRFFMALISLELEKGKDCAAETSRTSSTSKRIHCENVHVNDDKANFQCGEKLATTDHVVVVGDDDEFDDWQTILELARFQTELATKSHKFITTKASTIALAAIQNAFMGQVGLTMFSKESQCHFFTRLQELYGLQDAPVRLTRRRLRACLKQSTGWQLGDVSSGGTNHCDDDDDDCQSVVASTCSSSSSSSSSSSMKEKKDGAGETCSPRSVTDAKR